jgi:hypothetical protein
VKKINNYGEGKRENSEVIIIYGNERVLISNYLKLLREKEKS